MSLVAARDYTPRVLLVDHQDSFVHTLGDYFRQQGAEVTTLRFGFSPALLDSYAPDLVVMSPGPGRPADFGCAALLDEVYARHLPTFGVCLGLQAMVEHAGGALSLLPEPAHGKPGLVRASGGSLLSGLPGEFTAGRYHSLYAPAGEVRGGFAVTASLRSPDGADVVMAIEDDEAGRWAVQFHPESILTASGRSGHQIIANVLDLCRAREKVRRSAVVCCAMRSVEPEVFLVARPKVDYDAMAAYLREVGGERWLERIDRDQLGNDAQDLAEFAGKMCYRSWEPGLNPNVRKVRDDQDAYLQNILRQQHGSVLEHVSFTFVLHNVSRVFCYDDDTDVLTDEGWKPWPKIDGTETFGTLNPVTGELEYQKATQVFHADYFGQMYRVQSEQVDLLVTPNHRMWVQRHDTQAARRGEQQFAIEFPNDILHKRVSYQKSAGWAGHEASQVTIPGTYRTWQRKDRDHPTTRNYPGVMFPIEPFAKFLGYYLAEGSVNGHQIVLAQNRGEILNKMADT